MPWSWLLLLSRVIQSSAPHSNHRYPGGCGRHSLTNSRCHEGHLGHIAYSGLVCWKSWPRVPEDINNKFISLDIFQLTRADILQVAESTRCQKRVKYDPHIRKIWPIRSVHFGMRAHIPGYLPQFHAACTSSQSQSPKVRVLYSSC